MHKELSTGHYLTCGVHVVAGRRDDLWSWLYIVVEMLEGTLPWRTSSGDASAGSEHSPKETAQRLKQEALENPHILSMSGKLSGALPAVCAVLASVHVIESSFHCASALMRLLTPRLFLKGSHMHATNDFGQCMHPKLITVVI